VKALRLAYLALGLGLLWLVLRVVDLEAVWAQVAAFGALGATAIVLIYLLEFSAVTGGWQATLVEAGVRRKWFRRLFLVRLVGEAVNDVTPAGSLGGEPVKAVLLKKYYGVSYQASSASLVLTVTISCLALIVFLAGGFVLILGDPRFPPTYKTVAGVGLGAFVAAIGAFVAVQRYRVSSRVGGLLGRTRAGARLLDVLHHVEEFDDRLVRFYTGHRGRFALAMVLMLANWYLGVLAIWCTTWFLGAPLSLGEAYMAEAVTQLVRTGAFFIPAGLGAQEGAFVLVFEALTGQASLGLAVGLIKRGREILWIALGLGTGWLYSFKPSAEPRGKLPWEAREPSS
jgi:uncharacterized protein (TIRG00374 family)